LTARRISEVPRVLFVLGTTSSGGAENQCRYLLQGLRDHGVHTELAYFRRGPQHEGFQALGIPLHHLPAKGPVTLDWYRRALQMRRLVGLSHPDILHAWLYEAQGVGLVAAKAWPSTRVVLSQRSSAVLPRDRKHLLALRLLRHRVDHIVANSAAGAQMIGSRLSLSADQVSVVSNAIPRDRVAVNRDREEIRRELGIGEAVPVICSVGRIDHQDAKDYPTLFKAMSEVWAALPSAELVVVGPTAEQLEQLLGVALTPKVHAVGWQARPSEWMNAADLVAVHSRTEGHSNVADEAMMLGLPVATTDTGDHPALVRRAGGKVVPVGRDDLLSKAIVDLIRDPPRRVDVTRVAEAALSLDKVARAFLGLYARLLSSQA
jgi:glycosyltransferase involved in cell wall biosynthesis